jgi:acyl-CoA synthetase (AMP-forming)/AMP-acid ligase II
MGLIGSILAPLYSCVEIHLMPTKDYIGNVDTFLNLVESLKISCLLGPDFMYRQISRLLQKNPRNLESLRACMSGAELVLPSTVNEFKEALKKSNNSADVFQPVYGMAEACLGVTFHQLGQPMSSLNYAHGKNLISCGQALQGQNVRVVDENHTVLPELNIGEIVISGESVFEEYFMNKDLKRVTADGFYLTGDEGLIKDGLLYPVGRKKDVIISNGIKHFSVDLESHLFENLRPEIGRLACVQVACLYVVAEIPWSSFFKIRAIKNKIHRVINQRVQADLQNIILVPKFDLPRTTSGKIQRYKVIQKIENKEYSRTLNFLKSLFALLKNSKGLRQ